MTPTQLGAALPYGGAVLISTERQSMFNVNIGDRVKIGRDEKKYPSKGTWPRFRDKTGTVVEFNMGEIGVVFGKVKPRTDGRGKFIRSGHEPITWFLPREVTPLPAGKPSQPGSDAIVGIRAMAVAR